MRNWIISTLWFPAVLLGILLEIRFLGGIDNAEDDDTGAERDSRGE